MEQLIEFQPGFDKRHKDPNKNYGICGMTIRFVLKGESGATAFLIYTNWYPPKTQEELFNNGKDRYSFFQIQPIGADVGYHAREPQWEDQSPQENCSYLDGDPCYYDGSSLRADKVNLLFLTQGVEAVWKELEEEYEYRFGELV